jgi:hypothetical protein
MLGVALTFEVPILIVFLDVDRQSLAALSAATLALRDSRDRHNGGIDHTFAQRVRHGSASCSDVPLYFLGVLAAYLAVVRREKHRASSISTYRQTGMLH